MSCNSYFSRLDLPIDHVVQRIINMRIRQDQLNSPVFNYFEDSDTDTSIKGFNFECNNTDIELINYKLILSDLIDRLMIQDYVLLIPSSWNIETDGEIIERRFVTAVVFDGQKEDAILFSINDDDCCNDEWITFPSAELATPCSRLFDSSVIDQLSEQDQQNVRSLSQTLSAAAGIELRAKHYEI